MWHFISVHISWYHCLATELFDKTGYWLYWVPRCWAHIYKSKKNLLCHLKSKLWFTFFSLLAGLNVNMVSLTFQAADSLFWATFLIQLLPIDPKKTNYEWCIIIQEHTIWEESVNPRLDTLLLYQSQNHTKSYYTYRYATIVEECPTPSLIICIYMSLLLKNPPFQVWVYVSICYYCRRTPHPKSDYMPLYAAIRYCRTPTPCLMCQDAIIVDLLTPSLFLRLYATTVEESSSPSLVRCIYMLLLLKNIPPQVWLYASISYLSTDLSHGKNVSPIWGFDILARFQGYLWKW